MERTMNHPTGNANLEAMINNLIKIAMQHKCFCDDETCSISIFLVRMAAERLLEQVTDGVLKTQLWAKIQEKNWA